MRKLSIVSWGLMACLPLFFPQPAQAEMLNLGTAAGGQSLRLDTQSIQRNGHLGSWWSNFTYYLGDERINAGADCGRKNWKVDGETYTPQSPATRNMISIVCSARHIRPMEDFGWVLVYDPPSNVRSSPNGSVVCTIDRMVVISVYVEPQNGWYQTSACDQRGWIHESQIRAFR